MHFSNLEKHVIVKCYISCNLNAAGATQEYFERYYDRHPAFFSTLNRLSDNFEVCGYSSKPKYTTSNEINEVTETHILACALKIPSVSGRLVAADCCKSVKKAYYSHKLSGNLL